MTTRIHRHADVRLSALEDEGVVLHLGARKYFSVNATGLTILEALDAPKSFDEIVDAVVARYDVDRDQAVASARGFVDQCLEASLLVARAA